MSENKISLLLNLDQKLTPNYEPSERFLEVAIQASKTDENYQRPSLNLALVIDRSGSMAGEKLEYVKAASNHIVSILNEKDRVALVDFDERVRVHFPSTLLDAESKPVLLKSIASIRNGGMTNLCDGWLTGCQQIAGWVDPKLFTHSLLLTDGLANVGITDPRELTIHARELARRGVSTSTFGVGTDYNQDLLEQMANQGEGLFRFIEGPRDIPEIFKGVFKELLTILAHELEITFSYPQGLQVSLLGDWQTDHPESGKLRIYIGSLSVGKSRELYLKLSIPAGVENSEISLKVNLRAKDENGRLVDLSSEASIRLANKSDAESAPKDTSLRARYANAEIGDRASEALKLEKEGKRQEAKEMLDSILATHQNRIDGETHMHYQDMSQRMAYGMDELDRKRSHADAYMQKNYMSERRNFRLLPNVKGYLVFEYFGHLVLLDTGSQTSFGIHEHWEFMGRQVTLPPDFMKISTEYLSQFFGVPIEFSLGMDILKDLYFQINTHDKVITFSESRFRSSPLTLQLETIMDVPYTEISMNEAFHKVVVDTGACINLLQQEALAGLEPVEKELVFHPMVGEFETGIYLIPVVICRETHMMRCGVLPPLLEKELSASGIEGILGAELFEMFVASFERGGIRVTLQHHHAQTPGNK